jgi:activator of HSP90 ATPase
LPVDGTYKILCPNDELIAKFLDAEFQAASSRGIQMNQSDGTGFVRFVKERS